VQITFRIAFCIAKHKSAASKQIYGFDFSSLQTLCLVESLEHNTCVCPDNQFFLTSNHTVSTTAGGASYNHVYGTSYRALHISAMMHTLVLCLPCYLHLPVCPAHPTDSRNPVNSASPANTEPTPLNMLTLATCNPAYTMLMLQTELIFLALLSLRSLLAHLTMLTRLIQ
jgi:hypothetical protein